MSERVLAERYELGERLGSGGMSTVLLATDRRLERKVAIKLLAEHLADDAQFVTRFRREALSAARLVHPNIVQVYDFGEDNDSGRQYIVMEYVEGSSGAEILSSEGTLAVSEAVGILAQACRGLDYAHRSGVIHRDVKPGNLLRSRDGVVKLADFGIAKALSEESSITQVGSVLGTAAYLSPEQASGQGSNPRSDIYALGVVCYQFLSGRLPYEAQSITELALKQQREAPPLLNELNPDVSPELAAAVDRALELEPEARYETAEELRVALADGARGLAPATAATSVSTPRTAATTISQATGDQPATTVQRREPRPAAQRATPDAVQAPRRKRGWVAPTIVLLIALALGAAALVYVTGSSSNGDVRLRRVVYQQVDQTATQMQQLIRQNTK
jgi:serine/threonine-protein kinase